MKSKRYLKLIAVLLALTMVTSLFIACAAKDNGDDGGDEPYVEPSVVSLTSHGWLNPQGYYGLSTNENNLSNVNYQKASNALDGITKNLESYDLSNYTRLVISAKGDTNIMIELTDSSNTTIKGYTMLTSTDTTYQIDISGATNSNLRKNIKSIKLIAAPFSTNVDGSLQISKLQFDKENIASSGVINYTPVSAITNTYTSQTPIVDFNINSNWYSAEYAYNVTTESNVSKVEYTKLKGQSYASLTSKVSGKFSDFDFINFTVKGTAGKKIMFKVDPTVKNGGDLALEHILELDGTEQNFTLFIDELSAAARDSISLVMIFIEPGSIDAVSGNFEIIDARFSNVQAENTIRPEYPVNRYITGDTFSINKYWAGKNTLSTFTTTNETNGIKIDYQKNDEWGTVATNIAGDLSAFNYFNIHLTGGKKDEKVLVKVSNNGGLNLEKTFTFDENGVIKDCLDLRSATAENRAKISWAGFIPAPQNANYKSSFVVETAEFSKKAINSITMLPLDDYQQSSENFYTVNHTDNKISWTGTNTANALIGFNVRGDSYKYMGVNIELTVTEAVNVDFKIDNALYSVSLVPETTIYYINFTNNDGGSPLNIDVLKTDFALNMIVKSDKDGSIVVKSIGLELSLFDVVKGQKIMQLWKGDNTDYTVTKNQDGTVKVDYVKTSKTSTLSHSLHAPGTDNGYLNWSVFPRVKISLSGEVGKVFTIRSYRGDVAHAQIILDSTGKGTGYIDLTRIAAVNFYSEYFKNIVIVAEPDSENAIGSFVIEEAIFNQSEKGVNQIAFDKFSITGDDSRVFYNDLDVANSEISWKANIANSWGRSVITPQISGDFRDYKTLDISVTNNSSYKVKINFVLLVDGGNLETRCEFEAGETKVITLDLVTVRTKGTPRPEFSHALYFQLRMFVNEGATDSTSAGSVKINSMQFSEGA